MNQNQPTLLRTGNRILDAAAGLIYELVAADVVHVYRIDACNNGAPERYLKYKNEQAKALWAHVSRQALDLMSEEGSA